MSFGKLIQSNSVRGSHSSSGFIVTTKAVLGIVVVVALLVSCFIDSTLSIDRWWRRSNSNDNNNSNSSSDISG